MTRSGNFFATIPIEPAYHAARIDSPASGRTRSTMRAIASSHVAERSSPRPSRTSGVNSRSGLWMSSPYSDVFAHRTPLENPCAGFPRIFTKAPLESDSTSTPHASGQSSGQVVGVIGMDGEFRAYSGVGEAVACTQVHTPPEPGPAGDVDVGGVRIH